MLDPIVMNTKSAVMQHIIDLARLYKFHVSGSVPIDRAGSLALKFRDLYLTNLSPDQRYRRKKRGLGNAHLILWQPDDSAPVLVWILMVSPGDHSAHKLEPLLRDLNDRRSRLRIGLDYELVRHNRPGTARPSYSWQICDERLDRWRSEFRDAIRRAAFREIAQLWHSLHRIPGFARARAQAKDVARFAIAEWQRSRSGAFPARATRLGYIRRVHQTGVPLSAVVRAWKARERTPVVTH